jgi:ketosteroid isomerase-like protein
MSDANGDRVRHIYEAFNAHDLDAVEPLLHPDLVWYPEEGQPETGPIHGRESFLRYGREWLDTFEEFSVEPTEITEVGDCVAIAGRVHGIGRTSGVKVDSEAAWLWRFRDGIVVEHRECSTLQEALGHARESAG